MTYNEAEKLFATARYPEKGKPIANNTRLFFEDDVLPYPYFSIRLHENEIIRIHEDNTLWISAAGWPTPTTKERINSFTPIWIHQKYFVWYVGGELFRDPCIYNPDTQELKPASKWSHSIEACSGWGRW